MEFDKRTIIAFVLMGLLLVFMQTDVYKRWLYGGKVPSRQQERVETRVAAADTAVEKRVGSKGGTGAEVGVARAQGVEKVGGSVEGGAVAGAAAEGGPERIVVIRTPLWRGKLSTVGGRVVSWKLTKFLRPDSQLVEIVGKEGRNNLGFRFVIGQDTVDTGRWGFRTDAPDTLELTEGQRDTVRFWAETADGRKVEKVFVFEGGKYGFQVSARLDNWDQTVSDKSYRFVWGGGMSSTEARVAEDMGYTKAYALLGKSLEKFDVKNARFKRQAISGVTDWVATRTKYFTVAIVPTSGKGEAAEFQGETERVGKVLLKYYDVGVRMPLVNQQQEDVYQVYIGPLDYFIIRGYGVGLEKMMDFGWSLIRPISKGVLILFRWMHQFIPNYGVVLVLFSILVKLVVFPLTRKSYVSMKQMQLLQPRLAELKEKYGKDPQRLNKETMKLYKEHGVNPMSGCLPMLLQFPLLYALFIVFRSTIELRGAGFIWWIKDLSQPDTIAKLPFSLPLYGDSVNVLPIIMAITMLIQQKMSITDPKQKAMVYLMPIFFMLLFNNFPSGLNLYYTLFNVLTIIQQKMIPEPEIVVEAGKKGKGRKARR
ncbi:MAG: membrane protein insertase YidC [Calditrichaeota bacterium]|nr:membrane protein insertase YidC [Calditrichota bacterium]